MRARPLVRARRARLGARALLKPAVGVAVALGLGSGACYHLAPRRAEAGAPRIYAERCSTCHGPSGRGDGLAGFSLDPRPRDFADRAFQEAVSDEQIRRTIHEGGAAVGRSPLMPAHRDLSARELEQLVAFIRRVGASPRARVP